MTRDTIVKSVFPQRFQAKKASAEKRLTRDEIVSAVFPDLRKSAASYSTWGTLDTAGKNTVIENIKKDLRKHNEASTRDKRIAYSDAELSTGVNKFINEHKGKSDNEFIKAVSDTKFPGANATPADYLNYYVKNNVGNMMLSYNAKDKQRKADMGIAFGASMLPFFRDTATYLSTGNNMYKRFVNNVASTFGAGTVFAELPSGAGITQKGALDSAQNTLADMYAIRDVSTATSQYGREQAYQNAAEQAREDSRLLRQGVAVSNAAVDTYAATRMLSPAIRLLPKAKAIGNGAIVAGNAIKGFFDVAKEGDLLPSSYTNIGGGAGNFIADLGLYSKLPGGVIPGFAFAAASSLINPQNIDLLAGRFAPELFAIRAGKNFRNQRNSLAFDQNGNILTDDAEFARRNAEYDGRLWTGIESRIDTLQAKFMSEESMPEDKALNQAVYTAFSDAAKSGDIPLNMFDSETFCNMSGKERASIWMEYTKANIAISQDKYNVDSMDDYFVRLMKLKETADMSKNKNVQYSMLMDEYNNNPSYRASTDSFFRSASVDTLNALRSSQSSMEELTNEPSIFDTDFKNVIIDNVAAHASADVNYAVDLITSLQKSGPLSACSSAGIAQEFIPKLIAGVNEQGVDKWLGSMTSDNFISTLAACGTPQAAKALSDGMNSEELKEFKASVEKKMKAMLPDMLKQNPKNVLPAVARYFMQTNGLGSLSWITEDPLYFYGGIAALLLGGGALLGYIIDGIVSDDDDDEDTSESSSAVYSNDPNEAYRAKLKRTYSHTLS